VQHVLTYVAWCAQRQICHEFERFGVYMKVKVANFFGGFPIKQHKELLKTNCPQVIVGTPGRLKQVRLVAAVCCVGCL